MMTKVYKSFEELMNNETVLSLQGKVFVLPTDTIYGFSCFVNELDSVQKVRDLKQVEVLKPFIVLVSSFEQIKDFGIAISERQRALLDKLWPGPVSVIFDVKADNNHPYVKKFSTYNEISFRMPAHEGLEKFINKFGPIVSTSVNITKEIPINNVEEILKVFDEKVDVVLDIGELNNPPSTMIKIVR